jgi:hypothetical protein
MNANEHVLEGYNLLCDAVGHLDAAVPANGEPDAVQLQLAQVIVETIRCIRDLEQTGLIPADEVELRGLTSP